MVERSCWEVAKEYVGLPRWFSAKLLRDVPDCKVHRICCFGAKRDHSSFVGGDEKRDDCHPRELLLEFLLYRVRLAAHTLIPNT
jgi:hypothetical protein